MLRCFGVVFKGVINLNKLYFCFLKFYDEFEGGVSAYLALHSIYALARLATVEALAKKKLKKGLH